MSSSSSSCLLLLAFIGIVAQGQNVTMLNLLQSNIFANGTSCNGTKSSIPFALGDECNKLDDNLSWMVNCATNSRVIFAGSANCSYSSSTSPVETSSVPFEKCSPAEYEYEYEKPIVDFSCGQYPEDQIVIFTLGGGCAAASAGEYEDFDDDVTSVLISYALLVNTCMQLPEGVYSDDTARIGDGYFMVSVGTDGSAVYQRWEDDEKCMGTPDETITGSVNKCTVLPPPVKATTGRRLQSTGVMFKTTSRGVKLQPKPTSKPSRAPTHAPTHTPTRVPTQKRKPAKHRRG